MASGDKIYFLPKEKPQATTNLELSTSASSLNNLGETTGVVCMGFGNKINNNDTIVLGAENEASNTKQTIVGKKNTMYVEDFYILGDENKIFLDKKTNKEIGITIGRKNETIGQKTYVFGLQNTTTSSMNNWDMFVLSIGASNVNYRGVAIGRSHYVNNSMVFGISNYATGESFAIGQGCYSSATSAMAIGAGARAYAARSFATSDSFVYAEAQNKTNGSVAMNKAKAYTGGVFIGQNYFKDDWMADNSETEPSITETSQYAATYDGQTSFDVRTILGMQYEMRSVSITSVKYNGTAIEFSMATWSGGPTLPLTINKNDLKKGECIEVAVKCVKKCLKNSLIPENLRNRKLTVGHNNDDIFAVNNDGTTYTTGDLYVKSTEHATTGLKVATENLLGDAYDETSTYEAGDIVIHNNTLYKCKEDIDTPEDFDVNKWDVTKITNLLGGGGDFTITDSVTGLNYKLIMENGIIGVKEV